ncbi:hypothetical protein AALO_G00116420 [Alosa alosa]|uniref:T-box domain-containing protein n=1 Tax=Alosa alosa TaxID=278164 RepID=A0AAV6GUH3_9TELE|nr:hypothetical protein AALO_G00116420 [Alosa alosa]
MSKRRRTFFLSPSPGIVTLQITTEHSDDQAFAPATKTKMADQCGMCTFCPSERDMDGKIHVSLDNDSAWQEFHSIGTEMLLTREGSRMIPFCRFRLNGLAPHRLYFLLMDFQLVNKSRAQGGLSDTHKVVSHIYTHPSWPATGLKWMRVPVTFNMVKLTSDLLNDPRIVIQTSEFCAVSCYQNLQLINLKIKHNQFDHEEMHLGTYMQSPPGAAHESSASPSPDFNHTKNKWAKKPYLPTAAQLGLEASPVLKKKMDSEPSSPDDSSVVTETPSGPGLNGLAPHRLYFLLMDFQLVNKSRAQGGLSDTHKVVSHIYTHPSWPATGLKWMRVPVTFNMVKLTSDLLNDPRIVIQTSEFCAVSCYQNLQLINLKIKHNQFDHEEMHLGTYMQSPPGAAHESSASPSPDFNHTKTSGKGVATLHISTTPRAKKPYLPTAAQLGLEASPVLKKKMDSEPSSPDDSSVVTETPSGPGQVQEATGVTEPEEATEEGPEVQQESIVQLQKVLLLDLGSIKHRQVIHPALQQEVQKQAPETEASDKPAQQKQVPKKKAQRALEKEAPKALDKKPTRLLQIIPECNWALDRNLVLHALIRCAKLDRFPPSFKLRKKNHSGSEQQTSQV